MTRFREIPNSPVAIPYYLARCGVECDDVQMQCHRDDYFVMSFSR